MASALTPIWLGDTACDDPTIVGQKAATLSQLLAKGFPVPPGFCLGRQLAARVEKNLHRIGKCQELNDALTALIGRSASGFVLVRSSAIGEDADGHLFAGRFVSVPNVRSYDDLIQAISTCIGSVRSLAVARYSVAHGIDPSRIAMCVLVQEQILPDFAGVGRLEAKTSNKDWDALLEFGRGNSSALLKGTAPSYAIRVSAKDGIYSRQVIHGPQEEVDSLSVQLEKLFDLLTSLCSGYGSKFVVEWGSRESVPFVFQVRPLPRVTAADKVAQTTEAKARHVADGVKALPEAAIIGLKGAAMKFFHRKAWFSKPVVFLEPFSDLAHLPEQLHAIDWGPNGVTVRFSYKDRIGLPRAFTRNVDDAIKFIESRRQEEWFTIIHSHFDVVRSFELYVDRSRAVVEHLPGLWESENREPPDVITLEQTEIRIMRVTRPRQVVFENPRERRCVQMPSTTKEDLERWAAMVRPYIQGLRSEVGASLPLICHFIEDGCGIWQFLNLRRTGMIDERTPSRGRLHVVRSPDDMKTWNGRDSLLIQFAPPRGQEDSISEIATLIPRGEEVFVDAGVLSHPAMVLRESGVRVSAAYCTHEAYTLLKDDQAVQE